MRLTTRQLGLVSAGILLTASMLALVPLVTSGLPPLLGYVSVLTIYWVCFCLPTAVLFGRGPNHVPLSLNAGQRWIFVAALALPVMVMVGTPTNWIGSEPAILVLAILCALVNGPLEELAWRRTYRANSNGNLSFELLGLGLFTLWHVPLYFSKGVSFDYGAVGLVGGALVLGVVWTCITRRSNSVGWPIVSHTLVNIVAFPSLFATNFAS